MSQSVPLYPRSNPLARNRYRDTFIENEPQAGIYERPTGRLRSIKTDPVISKKDKSGSSSLENTPSSDATSQRSSLWSKPQSDDDELYNLTDDESIEVPLMISASVKKQTESKKSKYPPLIIPSPSHWPMPPSAKRSACSIGISPASKIAPSPARLSAFYARQHTRIPSRSSTPSLDGSLTSEELATSSCPSTPDIPSHSPKPGDWEAPAQLDPEAIAMLSHLGHESSEGSENGIDVPDDALREMMEIVRDQPIRERLVPGNALRMSSPPTGSEPVSALTVPSPGGFFASLGGSARQTWCVSTPPPPSTGTAEKFYNVPWRTDSPPRDISAAAEKFYGVPWRSRSPPRNLSATAEKFYTIPWRSNSPLRNQGLRLDTQQVVNQQTLVEQCARKDSLFSPVGVEATEITAESAFKAASTTSKEPQLERTKRWLYTQYVYVQSLALPVETPKTPEQQKLRSCFSPDTPSTANTTRTTTSTIFEDLPSKKSVRFLESVPESTEASFTHRPSADVEPLFFQGFQYLSARSQPLDAFLHAQTRVESHHTTSSSLPAQHRAQLAGAYDLTTPTRPSTHRPISALCPATPDEDEHATLLAAAERERAALEQIAPSVWSLQAARHVFGAQLLASPAIADLRGALPGRRVLDYGGLPSCDWGWAVALRYRRVSVVTVPVAEDAGLGIGRPELVGPENHSVVRAETPWSLPFPDAHFDVVSARNLHMLLKTTFPCPVEQPYRDEWDVVLREFLRVLKPGGYFEFNLLDAELLHPGTVGQALSVEFAFMLRQRGYDPQGSRYFLPRLRKAGFVDVKRAWMVLPAADVVPRWVDKGKIGGHGRNDSGSGSTLVDAVKGTGCEDEGTRFFNVEKGRGPEGKTEMFERPVMGSTKDVRGMTGLMGAREWERWVLKLQRETGGDEEKMLERVNRALEEGGKSKAGWRCLMGWARKSWV